jgi:hypothetical protein
MRSEEEMGRLRYLRTQRLLKNSPFEGKALKLRILYERSGI